MKIIKAEQRIYLKNKWTGNIIENCNIILNVSYGDYDKKFNFFYATMSIVRLRKFHS
jgi:hypothetical protein